MKSVLALVLVSSLLPMIGITSANATIPSVINVRLSAANKATMTDKSYWWTDNAENHSFVKFVVAGEVLNLDYTVTDDSSNPVAGATVTLTPTNTIGGAAFTGTMTGVTDSAGKISFSLTNTNTSAEAEPHPVAPSTLNYWDDSRGTPVPQVEYDLAPVVTGATTTYYDRVWAHVVAAGEPEVALACIRLSSDNKSTMTDKSYWWTNHPDNYSWVKIVEAGSTLTLNYTVNNCDSTPLVGKTVTLSVAANGASFSGALSGTTDTDGKVTFTLTSTMTDGTAEPHPVLPSTLSYWDDSRSVTSEKKYDITPTLAASVAGTVRIDRVWTHTVNTAGYVPPTPIACIRLSDADKASMANKSYWWTNEALSFSLVKFVVAGATLDLHYTVTDCSGTPLVGKTVTITTTPGGASFSGPTIAVTNASGEANFSFVNNNVDGEGEPYPLAPSTINFWDDSRSVSPEKKYDFSPSIGALEEHIDRVWTHTVNSQGYAAAVQAAAEAAVWKALVEDPKYFDPTSPVSTKLDVKAKTYTCVNAPSINAPTYAAYYLFVDRQLVAAKRYGKFEIAPQYPSINAAVDGTATLSSATFDLDPAWNSGGHTAQLRCEIQTGTSLNSRLLITATDRLPGVGKFVRRPAKGSTATVAPSSVTMRLISPVMTKDESGNPVDYVDFKNSPKDDNWAQYYGNADGGLGVFYRYLTVGSTLTLKYLVTDSDTKKPLANFPVWLMVNKNYGGPQRATWTYENNGISYKAPASLVDIGETQFAGTTDAYGYVSFTLVNANAAGEVEPKPAKLNAIQPATVAENVQSTITLTAKLSSGEVKETKDFLWIHIVKP